MAYKTFKTWLEETHQETVTEGKAKKCPKCQAPMGRHPNAEKAKKGYTYCGKCGTTSSPEAITPYKGSWADTVNK